MTRSVIQRMACDDCGTERPIRAIRAGISCRVCGKVTTWDDWLSARIDWAAIEWAAQGKAVRLNTRELPLAIRRLQHRLRPLNDSGDRPSGELTVAQLGALLGVNERTVARIKAELPAATRRRCPACRGDMWVLDASGVVEEHGDGYLKRCPMSDRLWRNAIRLHPIPQALLVLRVYALAVAS